MTADSSPSIPGAPSGRPLVERVGDVVAQFMDAFEIPGASIAIALPDGTSYVRGFGVRKLGQPDVVDEETRFAIASNSKAFLCACLAMMVDEGRLAWDDPVTDHLPEFRMHDATVTKMMTVRDLLAHRSGLSPGAGDLMLFPRTDHTAADILKALPHFKPSSGLREAYSYQNILYVVAGLILQKISGLDWDAFVRRRIFGPLGMRTAVPNETGGAPANRACGHGRLGPPIRGIGSLEPLESRGNAIAGPAGGIHASATEMLSWLKVQLARGELPDCSRLWSVAQADEMWTPRIITMSGPGPCTEMPERPVMQGYALGWGVNDYRGQRMVTHGGMVAGYVSRVALLPEAGLGLFAAFNCEDGEAISALRYALIDLLTHAPEFAWIGAVQKRGAETQSKMRNLLSDGDFIPPPGGLTLPLETYTGLFRDAWYGDVLITKSGEALAVEFMRTPAFTGALEPFGTDACRTRFPRGYEDAIIDFIIDSGKVTRLAMKALSPFADFSYDFRDLAFARVDT